MGKNELFPWIFFEEVTLLLTPGERFYDVAIFERRSGNVANFTEILDGLERACFVGRTSLLHITTNKMCLTAYFPNGSS
jgi:hypothetical protein